MDAMMRLSPPEADVACATPEPSAVNELVRLSPTVRTKLLAEARRFAAGLVALKPGSPEFDAKIDDLRDFGRKQMKAASLAASQLLERPNLYGESSASDGISQMLVQLQHTLGGFEEVSADVADQRFRTLGQMLDAIEASLNASKFALERDNRAILAEQAGMIDPLEKLAQVAASLEALDKALVAEIFNIGQTEAARANTLEQDLLVTVRQRRMDVTTQIAVLTQAYMALGLVYENNTTLIDGVVRAQTITLTAFRTGAAVGATLTSQRRVIAELSSASTTSHAKLGEMAASLKAQAGALEKEAVAATITMADVNRVYSEIGDIVSKIDDVRDRAVKQTRSVVEDLERRMDPPPYGSTNRTSRGA